MNTPLHATFPPTSDTCLDCGAPLTADQAVELCPSCEARAVLVVLAARNMAAAMQKALSHSARDWKRRGLTPGELSTVAELVAMDFTPARLAEQLNGSR